jgi:hypothetical protein
MTFACCLAWFVITTVGAFAQELGHESTTVTQTLTIEAIDKENRVVTLKDPQGVGVVVKMPDELEGFSRLKLGGLLTATYFRALAIRSHKRGEPAASSGVTTTVVRRNENTPGSETQFEQTFTVAVEAIDMRGSSMRVIDSEGRELTLVLRDSSRLQDLQPRDQIDVTYYGSLTISATETPGKQ